MKRFAEKLALVTGGSQGIGAAICAALVSEGAKVVIADKNIKQADACASSLGEHAVAEPVDVADVDSIKSLCQRVSDGYGMPDILVNNAGIVSDIPSTQLSEEIWHRELEVNLTGTFFLAREFSNRWMAASQKGTIVNISSISGFRVVTPEHHVAYDVAKAGVAHMTRVLAHEWAKNRIRVNAVGPGYTNTTILQGLFEKSPEMVQHWLSRIPMERLLEPSEIAAVVLFLASEDSSAITGQTVMADAGFTL